MMRPAALAAATLVGSYASSPMDNGRALRPPMGWRSWNQLGASTTQTDMVTQMGGIASRSRTVNGVPTSLKDLGYTDVGLDDFWQQCGSYGPNKYTYHNAEGTPVINSGKFPDMINMTTWGHSLGLTVGWYGNNCDCSDHCTDPSCYQGDVTAAFELGYDSMKLDGCGKEYDLDLWAALLNATGRPYLIENCHWGYTLPNATWCPWSYYRSSGDIRANYGSVMNNLQTVIPLAKQGFSYQNCWAFPDALEVGVYNGPGGTGGDSGLSFVEARSHFGAWCIVSSPLILSFDTTNATAVDSVWSIVTNTDAIAVNQAWYGFSGNTFASAATTTTIRLPKSATPSRSAKYGGKADPVSATLPDYQLFAKPLNASAMAVFVVNHASTPTTVSFSFATVPGLGYVAGTPVALYDVWAQAPAGTATTSWSATLASHDSAFLILNGTVTYGPPPCVPPFASANLTTTTCAASSPNQDWTLKSAGGGLYQLALADGSLCATVFGSNPGTGAPNVGLQPCLPAAAAQTQLFNPSAATLAGSFGTIVYNATGACVEVPDWDTNNGIELWTCNGGTNQEWAFDAPTGHLVYQNVSNYCVGVC